MEFSFHVANTLAEEGAAMALLRLLGKPTAPPVLLCVGSDLAIGDSLGPIAGTLLTEQHLGRRAFIYGTLRAPVTAKEIGYLGEFLHKTHPDSKVIAIDAAVGEPSEPGLIKITDSPLRPGSGANKRLAKVGDVSILGIVGEKAAFSYSMLNLTRLGGVYSMAKTVSRAIQTWLEGGKTDKNSQVAV